MMVVFSNEMKHVYMRHVSRVDGTGWL